MARDFRLAVGVWTTEFFNGLIDAIRVLVGNSRIFTLIQTECAMG